MNSDTKKIALIGLGLLLIYCAYKNKQKLKVKTILTLQQKIDLFREAVATIVEGIEPPQELLIKREQNRAEAKMKISELNLEREFESWLSQQKKKTSVNFEFPSAPLAN